MMVFRSVLNRHVNLEKCMILKRFCTQLPAVRSDLIEKSNYLFAQEQKRQLEEVGRIEKIAVEVVGSPEDVVLQMNQNISTPYDCAKHISQAVVQQAALALLDDKILWDMHRPLPSSCKLQFLKFKDKDPYSLNLAFWRTGSFILGAVAMRAFKDNMDLHLHSFPPPNIQSGSFIYDVCLNVKNWNPCPMELKILSAEFLKFVSNHYKIERLTVTKSLAMDIFEGNPFKLGQIPQIVVNSPDKLITLYRVGDHIDISKGPMVGDTSFFGRCYVAAVHPLEAAEAPIYRFQGVALPKGIMLNSTAFSALVLRGSQLNPTPFPGMMEKLKQKVGVKSHEKQEHIKVEPCIHHQPNTFGF